MTTEENPLMGGQQVQSYDDPAQRAPPTEDIYDCFSPQQRRVILTIVALNALVPSPYCFDRPLLHLR